MPWCSHLLFCKHSIHNTAMKLWTRMVFLLDFLLRTLWSLLPNMNSRYSHRNLHELDESVAYQSASDCAFRKDHLRWFSGLLNLSERYKWIVCASLLIYLKWFHTWLFKISGYIPLHMFLLFWPLSDKLYPPSSLWWQAIDLLR